VPLGAATAALGWTLGRTGLPSEYLFAALLVGLVVALGKDGRVTLPPLAFITGQAVTGVALGAYVRSSSLEALGHSWLPVTLVSLATLAASVSAGLVLSRTTFVDKPTGALGMVAGGASGIVAMADELGADDRLVAFMQYLRVLVVVLLTPLLIALLFPGHHAGQAGVPGTPTVGNGRGWLLAIGLALAGTLIARVAHVTAGTLLGPMIVAAIVVMAVPGGQFTVPPLLAQSAFALIGLQVGLRFTADTVRALGRLLLPVLGCILGMLAASFVLAVVLDLTTSVSLLDAYLATTPGGLYAVLAVAFGSGANTTFILAVQALRLFVMVLLAPVVVRRLTARQPVAA
jgi:membrane AbrB-like protein